MELDQLRKEFRKLEKKLAKAEEDLESESIKLADMKYKYQETGKIADEYEKRIIDLIDENKSLRDELRELKNEGGSGTDGKRAV
jgi:hypothetical protein